MKNTSQDFKGIIKNAKLEGWVSPVYDESRPVRINLEEAAGNRCVGITGLVQEVEHYKILRNHIMLVSEKRNMNTIMITSALPGEGKTVTAINLAFTFAKEFNHTVLLVDCDFYQQKIHKLLGYESEVGLGDAFKGDRSLKDIIVWPGVEKLTIISGGRTIPNSAELLGSPHMQELVSGMKARYPERFVLFDLPPVLTSADAIAFAPWVDAVLMVVQAGKTPFQDIKRALEVIPQEKFIGFVLNQHTVKRKPYYGI
ncbi:MAG: polysaccharide biosynthesis tyrosine autokinase [Thermodesulfobacteriota bacterium]|nr:MAG: polysaccharide biosynthesis tyrosine autokinase [Thermodesulfobacteriota bacterium]